MRLNKSLLILSAMTILFVGCGPMNTQPKNSEAPVTQQGDLSKPTTKNQFFVYLSLKNGGATALGDNEYTARFVFSKDLKNLSENAKVTFTSYMPAMPDMGKTDVQATRQADGSYSATLFYSMGGRWETTVKIEDNEFNDEYVFSAAL